MIAPSRSSKRPSHAGRGQPIPTTFRTTHRLHSRPSDRPKGPQQGQIVVRHCDIASKADGVVDLSRRGKSPFGGVAAKILLNPSVKNALPVLLGDTRLEQIACLDRETGVIVAQRVARKRARRTNAKRSARSRSAKPTLGPNAAETAARVYRRLLKRVQLTGHVAIHASLDLTALKRTPSRCRDRAKYGSHTRRSTRMARCGEKSNNHSHTLIDVAQIAMWCPRYSLTDPKLNLNCCSVD
jgi:hypothetical protein